MEPPKPHHDHGSAQPEGKKTCPHCGQQVPPLRFCVRCGSPLDQPLRRHEYAAHPGEPARALRLFSTLFPHLPQAGYDTFRHAFALGIAVVVVLVSVGLYPLALVGAAILVPVLFVLYFIEVDLYERAPLTIVAATVVWAIAIGAIVGAIARLTSGSAAGDGLSNPAAGVALAVVVAAALAVAGGALALLAPLSLVRHRAFNDTLDGATFGAIAGAVYASTVAIVRAADLFRSGLRPAGDPLPWLVRLATLGVAEPILVAASLGSVGAAFWLRFRAPVRDRDALGWLGRPAIAVLAGVALLGAAATARVLLELTGGLLTTALAAGLALVWLRTTIHLGLMEEAHEAEIGPPMRCANCGRMTPGHTFCGWCGVSLQAQPRLKAVDPGVVPSDSTP